jgi:hypothetical protein
MRMAIELTHSNSIVSGKVTAELSLSPSITQTLANGVIRLRRDLHVPRDGRRPQTIQRSR